VQDACDQHMFLGWFGRGCSRSCVI
jgi:hypothetical protein